MAGMTTELGSKPEKTKNPGASGAPGFPLEEKWDFEKLNS